MGRPTSACITSSSHPTDARRPRACATRMASSAPAAVTVRHAVRGVVERCVQAQPLGKLGGAASCGQALVEGDDRDARRAAAASPSRSSVTSPRSSAVASSAARAVAGVGHGEQQHAAVGLREQAPLQDRPAGGERGPRSSPPSSRASSACDGNRATGTPAGSAARSIAIQASRAGPGRERSSAPSEAVRIDRQQRGRVPGVVGGHAGPGPPRPFAGATAAEPPDPTRFRR